MSYRGCNGGFLANSLRNLQAEMMQKVNYRNLGQIEYGEAFKLQEEYMQKGLKVKSARFGNTDDVISDEEIEHYLFTCEHAHVYTLGKSGHMENLLVNDVRLKELGVSFYNTNRGGDITYHGPGQLVAYPVLDLEQYFTDLGKYMRSLEEAVIKTVAHYGIEAGRLDGATGVWLDADDPLRARKICAMGVKCSRWMTMHGLALNVNTDLSFFGHIVPCGISDKAVTSIKQELGHEVNMAEVTNVFVKAFGEVFESEIAELQLQG